MKGFFNRKFVLLAIILIASFLRFYKLGVNPPSLTWDEAAWGYNAYSLGQTGRDEFGRHWPLNYLESFGDFKPPVYAYLTVLPVKVFGLNEFATRFASAFFGVLTVLLTYYLVNELFIDGLGMKNKPVNSLTYNRAIPLIASFLLAVSPWHIMLSRAAFEANVATFFLMAGVTCFLIGVGKKGWFLLFSAAGFALSINTFNTARIVAPILAAGLAIGYRRKLLAKWKWSLSAFLLGVALLLPSLPFLLTPQARLRFKEVNIFSGSSVVRLANQEMSNDHWAWWSRIIHNRRWLYAQEYLRHYFDHFNPAFLFISGDGNPKFSTQDAGELYLWELPFLIFGTLLLFRAKMGCWWLAPFWLLAGIIPAATARETPHALRIEATLPTWQILTALGLAGFWQWLRGKRAIVRNFLHFTFYILLFACFIYFQHGYWRHYPDEYSGEWQYGYKQSIDFVRKTQNKYDEIWFTDKLGRPYIYFLFYLRENPRDFWREAKIKRDVYGFVKVESFGKYHFFRGTDYPLKTGVLYIDKAGDVPNGARVLKTFYLLNGREVLKAFEI